MHRYLAQRADFVCDATFQGKLYKVEWYPGVVASDNAADRVLGEVYRPHDGDVLARLDEYEGCGPGVTEPAEYIRRMATVRSAGGESVAAWIYLYNWPVDSLEYVPSGDFLDVRRE
jgi:gamma-glutamylcyclotransferase (GGCT)/AIG2-like uncharacterized protein YtfP